MPILEKKYKRGANNDVVVGAAFPKKLYQYLNLYVLAKGLSKSRIIRDRVEDWIEEKRMTDSEEDLVKQICLRITNEWLSRKTRYYTKDKFIKELKHELRKIDPQYMNRIIEAVTNEKN